MNVSHDIVAAGIAAVAVLFGVWKDRRNRSDTERFEKWKFEQAQAKEAENALRSYDLDIMTLAVEKVPPMLIAQIDRLEEDLKNEISRSDILRDRLVQCEEENRRLRREIAGLKD
jgi:hypothetical protein